MKEPTLKNDTADEEAPELSPYLTVYIPKKLIFLSVIFLALFLIAESIHRFQVSGRLKRRAERRERREDEAGTYKTVLKTSRGLPIGRQTGEVTFVRDPFVIYGFAPNQKSRFGTINSNGFRGANWSIEKGPGTKRILILGSSTAFGHGVKDDEVFAVVMEKQLKALYPKQKIEVLNSGIPGYLSIQDYMSLATKVLPYKPDMIVIFNGWNDFKYGSIIEPGEQVQSWCFQELERAFEKKPKSWSPLEYSSFYLSFQKKWKQARESLKKDVFKPNPRALSDFSHHLDLTVKLARSYGIKVLIAPQPEFAMRNGPRPESEMDPKISPHAYSPTYIKFAKAEYLRYREQAESLSKRLKVPYLDTAKFLQGHPEDQLFVDLVHLSAAGHKYCADALTPMVARILKLN
jgi:lysophospholipase L1-like esterase